MNHYNREQVWADILKILRGNEEKHKQQDKLPWIPKLLMYAGGGLLLVSAIIILIWAKFKFIQPQEAVFYSELAYIISVSLYLVGFGTSMLIALFRMRKPEMEYTTRRINVWEKNLKTIDELKGFPEEARVELNQFFECEINERTRFFKRIGVIYATLLSFLNFFPEVKELLQKKVSPDVVVSSPSLGIILVSLMVGLGIGWLVMQGIIEKYRLRIYLLEQSLLDKKTIEASRQPVGLLTRVLKFFNLL